MVSYEVYIFANCVSLCCSIIVPASIFLVFMISSLMSLILLCYCENWSYLLFFWILVKMLFGRFLKNLKLLNDNKEYAIISVSFFLGGGQIYLYTPSQ